MIAEAYSTGTPVVAANLGAMAELVDPGKTGLLFEAGNPQHLAAQVDRLTSDVDGCRGMRQAARSAFESCFTAAANYERLMQIYHRAQQADASQSHSIRTPAPA